MTSTRAGLIAVVAAGSDNRLRWWHAPLAILAGGAIGAFGGPLLVRALPLGIRLGDPLDPKGGIALAALLLGPMLIAALLFAFLVSRMSVRELGWRRPDLASVGRAGWAILIFCVLATALDALLARPEQETTLGFGLSLTVVALCVVTGVLAPLAEEVAFRGYLFAGFRRHLPLLAAAAITGILFGASYFLGGYGPVEVALVTVLGILWCVLRDLTGSIVPGLVLHGAQNALVLMAVTGQPIAALAAFGVLLLVAGVACLVR